MLSVILFAVILIINIGISYFNARAIAPFWRKRSEMGWGLWALLWSAAIQSAIGFSMPILLVEVVAAYGFGLLPVASAKASLALWYLLIIVPVIGTGLIITANSWLAAWKRRDVASVGTAAWNTAATAHDLAHVGSGVESAFSSIGDAFSSDDEGGAVLLLVVAIVVIALFSGAFITYAVIDGNRHRVVA